MKRIASRFFALSSASLLLISSASGRTRPRYDDAVRMEMQASISDYDATPDVLAGLVYETLVTHAHGALQPGLATSWKSDNGGAHWEFALRRGVMLHDGSPLTSSLVAHAVSKVAIAGCKILYTNERIMYECSVPQPGLADRLADPKFVIASVSPTGDAVGTGPFRIDKREHTRISLRANDDYWGGRPYIDSLEIIPGRSTRDQMADFAIDRADVVEIPIDQWRRAQQDRLRLDVSQPIQTVYLTINSSKPELRDIRLRQAISLSIDRAAIHNVIFQRQGEVAGGLLPNWLTGYAFLFNTTPDLARARQLRSELSAVPPITIGYDVAEPLERLIAERVALNVRDAGINMQAVSSSGASADIRLRRVSIASSDPAVALASVVQDLDVLPFIQSANLEETYKNERAALETYMAIPLVHLPRITAMKERIHNWASSPTGEWELDGIWVSPRAREGRP